MGNNNAGKTRLWTREIQKFTTQNPDRRRRIVEKLFDMAEDGDLPSMREIFDRNDGKPRQAVDVEGSISLDGLPVDDLMQLFNELSAAVETE